MMRICTSAALLLSVMIMGGTSHAAEELQVSDGRYLWQKPPGSVAEIFAPGIINTEKFEEKEGMFAANMNTFYFVRGDKDGPARQLILLKYIEGQWQQSVVIEGETEPSFSPDGKTLYFQDRYMECSSDGWSELKSLGAPIEGIQIMRPSVASSGTLYFDTFSPELDIPIRRSRQIDGKYEQPRSLGAQFAVGRYNAHPFVAPDESYIIWDSRRDGGYGTSDLYISFRMSDDTWGPAINLGDKINTSDAENYPSVSPDGKYIFFDRRIGSGSNRTVAIYWADAQIIEDLRPKP